MPRVLESPGIPGRMSTDPRPLVPARPHPREFANDCYVIAIATFMQKPYAEVFELLRGRNPEDVPYHENVSAPLDEVVEKLGAVGIEEARSKDYRRYPKALLIARWTGIWGEGCRTLHVVAWDGVAKKRVDPCDHDTIRDYDGEILKVLVERAASARP